MATVIPKKSDFARDMTRNQRLITLFFAAGFLLGILMLCVRFLVPEMTVTDGPAEADVSLPALIGLGVSIGSLFLISRS